MADRHNKVTDVVNFGHEILFSGLLRGHHDFTIFDDVGHFAWKRIQHSSQAFSQRRFANPLGDLCVSANTFKIQAVLIDGNVNPVLVLNIIHPVLEGCIEKVEFVNHLTVQGVEESRIAFIGTGKIN